MPFSGIEDTFEVIGKAIFKEFIMKKSKSIILVIIVAAFVFIAPSFTQNISADDSDYPNITTKYDVNNMSQYSDDQLDQTVTMKKFYVQGISYDKQHRERIIFTNTPESTDYYFTVLNGNKHHKKLVVGDTVTIKGAVGPRQNLEKTPANKFFSNKFFGKDMIFVITDSYK